MRQFQRPAQTAATQGSVQKYDRDRQLAMDAGGGKLRQQEAEDLSAAVLPPPGGQQQPGAILVERHRTTQVSVDEVCGTT